MPLPVGDRIRPVRVRDARSDIEHRIPWPPHGVGVLVFPHAGCEACTDFVRRLDGARSRFSAWGARVRVVVPEPEQARPVVDTTGLDVLIDDGVLHDAARVGEGQAAVVVIDVYGQAYASTDLDGHVFPDTDDLLAEARFPSLQCPECETPDVPGADRLPG